MTAPDEVPPRSGRICAPDLPAHLGVLDRDGGGLGDPDFDGAPFFGPTRRRHLAARREGVPRAAARAALDAYRGAFPPA